MTFVLMRKLVRDIRFPLIVVAGLLCLYQCLWVKITERVTGQLIPFFSALTSLADLPGFRVEESLFQGPSKVIRSLMGGENIALDRAMDMMSIGYVHPAMQTLFCIWAIGRAAGAIAGEIDKGTMELLMAQPIARSRVILAHLLTDALTIPVLCLSLWLGNALGALIVGEIQPAPLEGDLPVLLRQRLEQQQTNPDRLKIDVPAFGPALLNVGALIFAVTGYTMWLSSASRSRWRVLGAATLITLLQFLVNLLGQLWEALAWLRPFTVFYYYQPQQIILQGKWTVDLSVWNGGEPLMPVNGLVVLLSVGTIGYLMALWTFCRRDLPAPL